MSYVVSISFKYGQSDDFIGERSINHVARISPCRIKKLIITCYITSNIVTWI
jgi:hypothetical protein